jgi:hypothetical protein
MRRNWRNRSSWLDGPSVAVDDGDDAAAVVRDFFGEAPSRLTAAASFFGEGVTPPVAPTCTKFKKFPQYYDNAGIDTGRQSNIDKGF